MPLRLLLVGLVTVSQPEHLPDWQVRPVQQSLALLQVAPLRAQAQAPPWQTPEQQSALVLQALVGNTQHLPDVPQFVPAQQALLAEHDAPTATHCTWHRPAVQSPEQQSEKLVQLSPPARHVPQTPLMHCNPEQQPDPHAAPAPLQDGAAQVP